MASVGEVLEGKSICICAGSGGVGKTTTSAAIATGMAAQGLKVCVLTIDPAKRLADSLGRPCIDFQPGHRKRLCFRDRIIARHAPTAAQPFQ